MKSPFGIFFRGFIVYKYRYILSYCRLDNHTGMKRAIVCIVADSVARRKSSYDSYPLYSF
jgi:hypothetical protein